MLLRIVVCQPVAHSAVEQLRAIGDVTVWPGPGPVPTPLLKSWLASADAVMTMLTERVDQELISQAPKLKIAANMAVGYDNFVVAEATAAGVLLTNTPDVLTETTAELAWGLMLALMRNIVGARQALLAGQWTHWSPDGFLGAELFGKTLGIVGLGRIGQAVARRAPPFGMRVIGLGTRGQFDCPRYDWEQFLAAADVISLHVPLNPETYGMVNQAWFQRMKPGSYLINTARGPVVDESALLEALDSGHLAGAALDVFATEPIGRDNPLATHPRVVATPHIGSATLETRTAMAERAAQNIVQALHGQRPNDLVNPEAWPGRVAEGV